MKKYGFGRIGAKVVKKYCVLQLASCYIVACGRSMSASSTGDSANRNGSGVDRQEVCGGRSESGT